MLLVSRSGFVPVLAALCVCLPFRATDGAEIALPYGYADVRAQVAGIRGLGQDSDYGGFVRTSTHVVNDFRQPGTVDSYGLARARSASFDSIGVFASLDARRETVTYPGQFPVVDVAANASRSTYFRVDSDNLPLGSPVETVVRVRFDGLVSIADDSTNSTEPGFQNHATMESWVDAYDTALGDVPLLTYRGGAGYSSTEGFRDFADWDGRFQLSEPRDKHLSAALDYTKELTIQTTVGAILQFEIGMLAQTVAESPNDVAITVDFYNTGSFSFAPSAAGVQFTAVVPEPAGIALAGIGAGALLMRRRRR
jgi:hypothetical protein